MNTNSDVQSQPIPRPSTGTASAHGRKATNDTSIAPAR